MLAVGAVAAIAVGSYAWTQQRVPVVALDPGSPSSLAQSPIFDPGSTVFARGEETDPAEPAEWRCTLEQEGRVRELLVRPDFDAVGSRVVKGVPFVPVVTVGTTVAGDVVQCDPATGLPSELFVMPSDVGVRAVPLAFVVGGIAGLGIAGLLHPRGRGIRRFGS